MGQFTISTNRAKQHHQLADRLVENLKVAERPGSVTRSYDGGHGGLLYQLEPRREIESLILSELVRHSCNEIIEEQLRADLLRSYGLEPRHRILLVGPPGNGKTSLAESIAHALALPFFVARYEAVVGSFLGETSSRLKKLFDFVRTQPCVLFFDEFDTLGKERGDVHETGEIKRVVSSLLLQIDALPSYTIVITATNHPELLDRAVWRRFEARFELPPPTQAQAMEWFDRQQFAQSKQTARQIVEKLKPTSFSELEDFCLDVKRRLVLAGAEAEANITFIIRQRLEIWAKRISASTSNAGITKTTRGGS